MPKQLISSRQMAHVRKVNESFMPDSATVLTPTVTKDGLGGDIATYAATSSYPCRFRPASDADRRKIRGGQEMTDPIFVATLPYDAVIGDGNRLRIGSIDYDIIGWLGSRTFKAGTILALKQAQPELSEVN